MIITMKRLPYCLVPTLGPILVLIIVTSGSPLCPRGVQYWDTSQQTCTNCTSCATGQIVLRPCQPHIDTYCGPLSALRIDWPWVRKQVTTVSSVTPTPSRVTHKPRPKKVIIVTSSSTITTTTSTSTVTPEVTSSVTRLPSTTPEEEEEEEEDETIEIEEEIEVTIPEIAVPSTNPPTTSHEVLPLKPAVSAQPFSASEALVWDWQALTMIIAVTSCAIFMVILATYAVIQARSATGRRRQLQKELEEAAAHLSLFTMGPDENSADGLLPQESTPTNLTDPSGGLYTANQCLFLEKLLERKQRQNQRGTRGNIYVETGRQATPSPARRWKANKPGSLC